MKINPKSEKGAITLVVLVGMLFLTTFLMSVYITTGNKARTSAETTNKIAETYNNIGEAEDIYNNYFADTDVIPIYTKEQLIKIGSEESVEIKGKIYTFSTDGYYTIQNDLDLGGVYNESTGTWDGTQWTPITSNFTGILDGLGNTITGLYIDNVAASNQGLFGTLNGTVKNLNILGSYIKANENVGAIAGINNGTIEKCNNKATVIGTNYVGGIAGNLTDDIINCSNTGNIVGTTNVTGGYFKAITTGETIDVWSNNVLEENAYYVSGKYTATAPKGFKVSKNVFEQTIEDGMVVQDADENEFVWIPVEIEGTTQVEKEASFETIRKDGYYNNSLQNAVSKGNILEPYAEGYTDEEKEYNKMRTSVIENEGFYIGRYEAGIKTTENSRIKTTTGSSNMVVQRDCYPYTYVGWGNAINNYTENITYNTSTSSQTDGESMGKGALLLSKELYGTETKVGKYGVTSTLCYGIQWDAMMRFIEEAKSIANSTTWGNYQDNPWIITRKTAKYTTEPETDNKWTLIDNQKIENDTTLILLTTGADDSFAAKNIYDVAGNVSEWTNEVNSKYRVIRSGSYLASGSSQPASLRGRNYVYYCSYSIGFRVALYIS